MKYQKLWHHFTFTTVQTIFAVSGTKELQTEQGQMHYVYIDISLVRTSWILLSLASEELKHFLSITSKIFNKSEGRHTFSNRALWHFTFLKIYDLPSGRMTYFSYNVIFWNVQFFTFIFSLPFKARRELIHQWILFVERDVRLDVHWAHPRRKYSWQ